MNRLIETERIEDLHNYGTLDIPADGEFDEVTALAANVFKVPIAIITLVDRDKIWFKSPYALDNEFFSRDIDKAPGKLDGREACSCNSWELLWNGEFKNPGSLTGNRFAKEKITMIKLAR